jgi:hypothetical protein
MKNLELFDVPIPEKYKLPEKYKGNKKKNGGYTHNTPRSWTKEEIGWAEMLKKKGLNIKSIAKCLDRDVVSVSVKMKRLQKKDGISYNDKHRGEKYETNKKFLELIKPKSVLDLYAGATSYYFKKTKRLTSNDIMVECDTSYNMDSFKLICKLYSEGEKYDLIDLDPFGSAFDCFDIALKMAKKGIIITFGEYGHKRWGRLDFLGQRYDMKTTQDIAADKFVKKIKQIAKRNKKKVLPVYIKEWRNIVRIYFKIK